MIKWAGWILLVSAIAHVVIALAFEGAAGHVDAWLDGALRHEDLSEMSAAGSAYWLTMASFGPPTALLGGTVLWMGRRGITPPTFIAWTMVVLNLCDAVVFTYTPWPLGLVPAVLLLLAARRAEQRDEPATMTSVR